MSGVPSDNNPKPKEDKMDEKKQINLKNLIELSGFDITLDEEEQFTKEISDFLEYAEIINNFEDNGDYDFDTFPEKPLREDVALDSELTEMLLKNAPFIDKTGYFVPPHRRKSGEEEDSAEGENRDDDARDYEAVIGLEVHAQLTTKSKLFCSCSTEFGKTPNQNTCPVCSGQPGVLPALNAEAVKMAIKAGLSLNCSINKKSVFARKNYFYPDLPKSYQISQFEEPICSNGYLEVEVDNVVKKIRINRIHIEEDAGKMIHVGSPGIWGAKASSVDFNRAGRPLIEIVTEPDISSPQEAKEYVVMLRAVLTNLGICDGNMEEGSLRCDANVSIRKKGESKLGVKTEIKNVNSFKAIERSLIYEINRQKRIKKRGGSIGRETRLWDEGSQKTILMRTKGESSDYRCFPDPDLLPLTLDEELIAELKKNIPDLPLVKKKNYMENFGLSCDESRLLVTNPYYMEYFENTLKYYDNTRNAANWFFNEVLFYLKMNNDVIHFDPPVFAGFLRKIDSGEINGKIGKEVIKKSFESKINPLEVIENSGYKQITDKALLSKVIDEILKERAEEVIQYKNGKSNLLAFFVGEVMKETKGKANPALVNEIIAEKLKV